MTYHFKPSESSIQHGLRRIAVDQFDRALRDADDHDGDIHVRVHDMRKRGKQLRGLIRLVRPSFPAYAEENAAIRDAARLLSDFRDKTSALDTCDHLADAIGPGLDRHALEPLREALLDRRHRAEHDPDLTDRLADFRREIAACRDRALGWELEEDSFDVLRAGFEDYYRRGRDAMKHARETGHAEDMHEWRKRVKDHGHHARLLRRAWPRKTKPHIKAAGDLGDLLGTHHNYAVFQVLLQDPSLPGQSRHALAGPAAEQMEMLEKKALGLGAHLYAEKPKALSKRWAAWWRLRQ
ncbi:CHAD domain-containing protein [Pseudoruegeria sp. HB172150]|uniref:CHAD domain-containing protein n=1 Tax=Pseudoruegeria sp. HB172150 TaxID=2721164 RepID=UPI00155576DC|nr:CHAD domain-containing protein [Pseudoruegeria sp. HB172150]